MTREEAEELIDLICEQLVWDTPRENVMRYVQAGTLQPADPDRPRRARERAVEILTKPE